MQLKSFVTEKRAVSPVIGVILMVAITVILAAVIGTFVLGLGDQVGDTAPNANFDVDVDDEEQNVTFTHSGGDQIDPSTLKFTTSGDVGLDSSYHHDANGDLNVGNITFDQMSAGDSLTAELDDNDGTVNLVWDTGDRSSILRSVDVTFGSN
ncbi:type IV pilin N-terminal domain-containing protein [Halalkaliarchaeum sp. AArc-GB]|uniref:type IV pilin N-terminal domain-containing protein n=1 Tax=Halalkaliarchaeum sp. AArc-GB TaxID=3074078 RepID=UPI00285856A0|nr:type IV pilin N-terminal domain-containing protein [Halalkaliarchaeum sp. AArc-GB]MDR5674266.1 type IV pilin N-terminal domain-containing protein [Halalkaliarchaeum sp. AArc-GB]